MHCQNCGTEIPSHAKYCSSCGSAISTSHHISSAEKPKNKSFRILLLIFSILMIAGLGSYLYLSSREISDETVSSNESEPHIIVQDGSQMPHEQSSSDYSIATDTVESTLHSSTNANLQFQNQCKNEIRQLVQAEDDRNLDKALSFYSPNIKRYWDFQNPNTAQLRAAYTKNWAKLAHSENMINNIEVVNNNTYILDNTYIYTTKNDNQLHTKESKIKIVFDENGKIIESYGIN